MSTHQNIPETSPELASDATELQSALEASGSAPAPGLEEQATATSATLGKQYHPTQVPYVNDNYTFADREEELRLLQGLLTFRVRVVNEELTQIAEINRTRTYPNIAFQAPNTDAQGK